MRKENSFWIIEPLDALIVRDGRPFGRDAGNRADSLEFPFPSTTTGAARTRAGLSVIDNDLSKFKDYRIGNKSLADFVQENIEVSGAILAEIKDENKVELLFSAPADAVLFEAKKDDGKIDEKNAKIIPLLPLENDGFFSNLNEAGEQLRLLGLEKNEKSKPYKNAPKFWRWTEFEKWLKEPKIYEKCELKNFGIGSLEKDRRTHIEMDYGKKSGKDGGLFETRGLEFTRRIESENGGENQVSFKRYGLILRVATNGFDGATAEGIAPLGGERRLVSWSKVENPFPEIDKEMKDKIIETGTCRLILLTPAIFENGFYPTFGNENIGIEAAAVNRYQVISGWDFKNHHPKPTRRMCPAGSVFFLKFRDKTQVEKWIEETWFNCISDDEQDRRDGFGLAVIGNWNGEYLKLEDALNNEKNS